MTLVRPVRASAQDVEISACAHGAHLLNWETSGVERLWMSPVSRCGEATAIRGGVPLLFPQFGTFGPLPKHGFARTLQWRSVEAEPEEGRAVLAFQMRDSAHTREIWPHPFHASVTMSASAGDLRMTLEVTNHDEYDARFTAGLHTYFAVADPLAWISGLSGSQAWDGVDPVHPTFDRPVEERVAALAERDMAVHDVNGPVALHDATLGSLEITAEGFPDRVVWNPGPQQCLPDVPSGMEAQFVCIEPAALNQVSLAPGQTWVASQTIRVA